LKNNIKSYLYTIVYTNIAILASVISKNLFANNFLVYFEVLLNSIAFLVIFTYKYNLCRFLQDIICLSHIGGNIAYRE